MTDFRGPLPLDDRDFAKVRRQVISKLQRRPIAPIVFRFAAAAVAAIALAIIILPRSPRPGVRPPIAVRHPARIVAPPPPPIEVAQEPPVKPPPKPTRIPEQLVATAGPPPDSEITMNIQTADPNVRIIWIAQR